MIKFKGLILSFICIINWPEKFIVYLAGGLLISYFDTDKSSKDLYCTTFHFAKYKCDLEQSGRLCIQYFNGRSAIGLGVYHFQHLPGGVMLCLVLRDMMKLKISSLP